MLDLNRGLNQTGINYTEITESPLISNEFPSQTCWNVTDFNATEYHLVGNDFSTLHITLAIVVVGIIIFAVIAGNMLVIYAIATDKTLEKLSNCFIVSLSLADLLLGILIMPLSLANQLMGFWPFGPILCDLWLTIDVLLCTASILNLCAISLDRYWLVTKAVTYMKQRTSKHMAIMMGVVWALSCVICIPPLLGWKKPHEGDQCLLSQDIGYIVYSTMGSFFVPSSIIIFMYWKIYAAATRRSRHQIRRYRKQTGSVSNGPDIQNVMESDSNTADQPELNNEEPGASRHSRMAVILDEDILNENQKLTPPSFKLNIFSRKSRESQAVTSQTEHDILSERVNRRKRKIAKARERRATIVVGIVTLTFILSWLPFFGMYLITSLAKIEVNKTVFDIAFWLGYCNSAFNPVIYTIFNKEFRDAFKRILIRKP